MPSRRVRIVATAAAAVAALTVTAAVTAEAESSSSPSVHACETSKGYLTLASTTGHCAHGQRAVSINKHGPRGQTGKTGATGKPGKPGANGVGATSASIDISTAPAADVTRTIGTLGADTFTLRCTSDFQEAEIFVNAESDTYVHGLGDAVGFTYFSRTDSSPPAGVLNIATEITGGLGDPDFEAYYYHATASQASGHVLILAGRTTGTLDFSLYTDGSRCQADAQLTPSTTHS